MGLPPLVPPGPELSVAERSRYARHVLLPEVGAVGQRRIRAARVLVVGAGGLGSPALLYLAAAGVGTLGVVDDDVVDRTNLQRQVVHGDADVGRPKTASAAEAVQALNPEVVVVRHDVRLDEGTALGIVADYDVVLDGADNFPTRYLVGDACARLGIPHVWGSVYRFDGQVSVWFAGNGPCYACVFPQMPAPDSVPSCSTGGVVGAVCASVGSVMVTEALKLVTGIGEPLVGRLLVHDALRQRWDAVPVRADPRCPVCGPAADPLRPLGRVPVRRSTNGGGVGSGPDSASSVPEVSVAELAGRLRDRAAGTDEFVLLDVREPGEREVVTIPGDVPVPLAAVRAGAHEPLPDGIPVLVYCRTGARSAEAAAVLRARGIAASNVAGGVLAWVRDVDPGLPAY
jgi:adenylyltransferase/sulfurtransferase